MLRRTPLRKKSKLKKVSDLGKAKRAAKKILMSRMIKAFEEIWEEREHFSEVSNKFLGYEPTTTLFHHILPRNLYPEFTLFKDNIILLTFTEHQQVENDPCCFEEINRRREQLKIRYGI